ncbi:MAG TPA: hypothetical protein VFX30_14785 [bacterium]|nr:hypothetical protein [bacterium]
MGDLKLADVVDRLHSALRASGGTWDARFSRGPEAWVTNDAARLAEEEKKRAAIQPPPIEAATGAGGSIRSGKSSPQWIVSPNFSKKMTTAGRRGR